MPLSGNPNHYEDTHPHAQYLKATYSSISFRRLLLLGILLSSLLFIGLVVILAGQGKEQPQHAVEEHGTAGPGAAVSIPVASYPSKDGFSRATQLPAKIPKFSFDVSGTMEAGSRLKFTAYGMEEGIKYEFDFGNGDKKTLASDTVYYIYPDSGSYVVFLSASIVGVDTNRRSALLEIR